MGILFGVLTVFFFILCALLILIILLQSDKSAGMGILGGSSQTAFGSSTADVITKITTAFVALFMGGALGISILESYRARSFDPTGGDAVKVQNIQQDSTSSGGTKATSEFDSKKDSEKTANRASNVQATEKGPEKK
ncbi:MAG: preprotein translocase subunit SecG [Spirochaetes bacterium]|nr:preprotein translocase subunit SecG [Spirochaetota bacterium]